MVTLERSVFRNLKKTIMTVMVELVFQAQSQCKKDLLFCFNSLEFSLNILFSRCLLTVTNMPFFLLI